MVSCQSIRGQRRAPRSGPTCRPLVETVESRILLATAVLSSGEPGAFSVMVDSYGAFGARTTAGDVSYQPPGGQPVGAVLESAVYFGPAGRFLSSASIEGTEDLPEVGFDRAEGMMADSRFRAGGFSVSLSQIVAGGATGARLSQIYSIRNDGVTPRDLRLVRHVNTDVEAATGIAPGAIAGGREVAGLAFDRELVDNGLLAYAGAEAGDAPYHVSIFNHTERYGADDILAPAGPTGYAAGPAAGGFASIAAAGGIPADRLNVIGGDADENGVADAAYDAALSLQSDFLAVGPGETVNIRFVTDFRDFVPAAPAAPAPGGGARPTASLALPIPPVTNSATTDVTFVMRYEDDVALDVSSFGDGDVLAYPAFGASYPATLVGVEQSADGAAQLATYRYTFPGGIDSEYYLGGTYTLWVAPGEVTDVGGRAVFPGRVPGGTFEVTVRAPEPQAWPDLVAGPVRLLGRVRAVGFLTGAKGPATEVRVENRGAAALVRTVNVSMIASTDGLLDDADVVVGTFPVRFRLAPGRSQTLRLRPVAFPAEMADGDYLLLARVDADHEARESDETNNVSATASALRVAAPRARVGFAGPVVVRHTSFRAGAGASVLVPVQNLGNVASTGLLRARLAASADGEAGGADDRLLANVMAPLRLKAGAGRLVRLRFTVPADLPAGNYLLSLVLEPESQGFDTARAVAFGDAPITVVGTGA